MCTSGHDEKWRQRLLCLCLFALLFRVAFRLCLGPDDFWNNGYRVYFELAQSIANSGGLSFGGEPTAFRVPLYPMLLAAVSGGHQSFLPIIIMQAAIGACTVFCVGLLARMLFGTSAAVPAGLLAAFYPYYVIHDTALQETSLFTLLTLVAVLLSIRARRTFSPFAAAAAGAILGLDLMTRATIAPFVVFPPAWLLLGGTASLRKRGVVTAACVGAMLVVVAPWFVRAYSLTGGVTLGTETGSQLWAGNNEYTFSRYPMQSIDRSVAMAFEALSPAEVAEQDAIGPNERLLDQWFMWKAVRFMREHPVLTASGWVRKVSAAFSWIPSPRRSFWPTVVYAASYGAIMVLGVAGMLHAGRSPERSLIYALFGAFVLVTAVFFGHTSHRAYLDVYWMAYAGYPLSLIREGGLGVLVGGRWKRTLTLPTPPAHSTSAP